MGLSVDNPECLWERIGRMKYPLCVLLLASALGVGAPLRALAGEAAPSVERDPVKPEKPGRHGYLPEPLSDTDLITGPPPTSGSAAFAADLAAYWGTRGLKGSSRWALATKDGLRGAATMLDDFACALGRRVDPAVAPKLMTLFDRVHFDVESATRGLKDRYRRTRPHVDNDAPLCVERAPRVPNTFSYPSSHATLGWTLALTLASLVPERASGVLARGRVYGESRVVCGLHWGSDVEAGRAIGAALFAALESRAVFRADLDAVRAELEQALVASQAKPDPEACEIEAAAARTPLWERAQRVPSDTGAE
jgi:acid phosphatase (class A)